MSSTALYTIIVSGEKFAFTKDQLESDPGNYFTTYFLWGFEEARQGTNELTMEREPMLFRLIQAHLRGYDIFPLPNSAVPSYMTTTMAVNNLLKDAQFFGLNRLCQKIQAYLNSQMQKPIKSYKLVYQHKYTGWKFLDLTEGSFQLHLQQLSKISTPRLFVPHGLVCPTGYRIHIAWFDGDHSCVLLVPVDDP